MRICHMTSAHDSDDIRIFQKECVSLAAKEHEVYLVARGESRIEKNVIIKGIGEPPRSRIKRMITFSKSVFLHALEIDADIYHFHDPELLKYGLKLKRRGKKVIFDSHENTFEQIKIKPYLPKVIRVIVARAYKLYETFVCRRLDAVIFPCTVNGENPFKNRCKETVFINNYPFLSEFNVDDMSEPTFDVCVIGSLTYERGITYLLEAARIANAKVVLAGIFSPDTYEQELCDKGLLNNVVYKGICNREEVLKIYRDSIMTVSNILPIGQYSLADNLPTKVYECMAMGKPVIISNMRYPLQILDEYRFGLAIDPSSPNDISECIIKLKNDRTLRKCLGDAGRKAIEEKFSWEKDFEKLNSLYERLFDK